METYKNVIKERLDKEERYREMLFRRGYLITSNENVNIDEYPFYGLWKAERVDNYNLYVHREQTYYIVKEGDISVALVGHAYNPFDMKYDENDICKDLIDAYKKGLAEYFDKVSELTGLHVIHLFDSEKIISCQDACSLTGCYFGKINNEIYIAEHPQLIADLCDLNMNKNVAKLVQSKCYNIGNRYLPGNITPYDEVKKIGANTYLEYTGDFKIKRFYPVCAHPEFVTDEQKQEGIKKIGDLIHNGIECCAKKWDKCTISLSGGTDSKTTLACANGVYDRYSFFSFYSKPQEKVDADGAHDICEKLGLEHTIYPIPETNEEIENFDFIKTVLQHNTSYITNLADNEIRKYVFLHDMNAYDIELKSWASEVARVFFERKLEIKIPKVLNERHCSIFQTRFFGHPGLLRWSDRTYFNYLKEIGLDKPLYNFEHSDLIYWEVRMGSWGVSVISSQQLYHRMSMPMNNRKILELFLCFPHNERKSDSVHKRVMEYKNKGVVDAKVEIPNLYFHAYRIWLEKIYYYFRTLLYIPKKK